MLVMTVWRPTEPAFKGRSMMSYGGDTSGLGFQLAMYRWLDDMDEARRIREHGNSLGIAQAQLDWITAQHNDLVARFNRLRDAAIEAARIAEGRQLEIAARDARIADLEAQLAAAQAETLEVREHWGNSTALYRDRAWAAEDALEELRSQHS